MVFYYPEKTQPLGKVTMQVFGQHCRKCARNTDPYIDPIFEPHTIAEILEKLHERIGWNHYNKPRPPKKKNDNNDEGLYNINGEHESHLCEACKSHICSYEEKVH